MQNEHISWLDIAKGIAIILMVLGHTSIPKSLSNFIWAFHMPLFFIAAGWSTDWKKRSVKDYILHRMKTLMLPFFTYSIIVSLILCNHNSWKGLSHLLCNGWEGYPLWFIPVLFIASIISRIFYEENDKKLRLVIMAMLLIIGVSLNSFKINLPWTMSSVAYASFLVVGGRILKNVERQINYPKIWKTLLLMIITLIISMMYRLDMAWNNISPVIPLTIGAVSGTLMVFMISSYIDRNMPKISRIIASIGRETCVVVAFASGIIMIFNQYLSLKYISLVILLFIIAKIKNKINSFFRINMAHPTNPVGRTHGC